MYGDWSQSFLCGGGTASEAEGLGILRSEIKAPKPYNREKAKLLRITRGGGGGAYRKSVEKVNESQDPGERWMKNPGEDGRVGFPSMDVNGSPLPFTFSLCRKWALLTPVLRGGGAGSLLLLTWLLADDRRALVWRWEGSSLYAVHTSFFLPLQRRCLRPMRRHLLSLKFNVMHLLNKPRYSLSF